MPLTFIIHKVLHILNFFALKLRQLITVLRKRAAGLNYLKRKLIFTALPKDKVGNPINYDGL